MRAGVFEWVCNKCGGTEWQGQSIPLELEHRDGNPSNNQLDNVELLCPNCHAQTPTYRSRNRKRA
jgi:5-methylcytosine-specific restriction endonuclease McrA